MDAVYIISDKGIVIPLANYTLQPIKMTLDIEVDKPFHEVRSVNQGLLKYEKIGTNKIRVRLPLECTDFITIQSLEDTAKVLSIPTVVKQTTDNQHYSASFTVPRLDA